MKTLYLKEKRSGNFEISNRKESTIKFNTVGSFKMWYNAPRWEGGRAGKVIKAAYRLSQTYFHSANEVLKSL